MRITEAAHYYAASAFWLRRMIANRAVSPERLRRRQISRLRAVLSHARGRYPFYRARLEEAGIDPDRFADLDDLRRLPPLDRETYREFAESPETESVRLAGSTTFGLTSGSSGRPVKAFRSPGERARQTAKFFMALFLNGYRIRDKTFQISMPGEATIRDGWQRKLGILGGTHVSGGDDVTVWIDAYRRLRPEILYSDLCHLVRLALYAAERGLSLARPKLCVSYGETMDGASRKILDEAFGGENTVQMYGSAEFGLLGFQTRTAPFFHLSHETNYFELETGPAAEGAGGVLLVTDLHPRPCPLIRYRLGDSVVFGLESGIPVLRSIIGRENDLIRLPDGSRHGSPVFEMVMERRAEVLQYRIVQSVPDELDVYLVARKESDHDVLAGRIVADLEREFSAGLRYRVHLVPRIDPDPSGKLRALVSTLEKTAISPPRDMGGTTRCSVSPRR